MPDQSLAAGILAPDLDEAQMPLRYSSIERELDLVLRGYAPMTQQLPQRVGAICFLI